MPKQAALVKELRATTQKLGTELAKKRQADLERVRNTQRNEIDQEIRQVPIIAQNLIEGLPDFLTEVANAGYGSAYVVYRPLCKPWEQHFPKFIYPSRKSSFNNADMTEYAVRRYIQGIAQHVALWGIKQEFQVGLTGFNSNRGREIEHMVRNHNGVLPFYRPGMFCDDIPDSYKDDFVFFAW